MRTLLVFLMGLPALASGQAFKPVSLSLSDGLSQSCVYSIVQDGQGFIWMATQDGLNRFDGIGFEVFRNEPFDTSTLANNFILELYVDSRGWLWVVTRHQGLSLYVPSISGFRNFDAANSALPGDGTVNGIDEDASGRLWLATAAGLAMVTVEGHKPATAKVHFRLVPTELKMAGDKPAFSSIAIDHGNTLWGAFGDSLLRADIAGERLRGTGTWHTGHTPGLSPGRITGLTVDARSRVWVASGHGISWYAKGTNEFISLGAGLPELEKCIKGDYISALYGSSSGTLWIGTSTNGLFRLDRDRDAYSIERVSLGTSRHSNMVLSIHEDRINPGMMWVGTFAGGTFKLVPVLKNFHSDFLEYEGVETPLVTAIMRDRTGVLWIGTPTGLFRFRDRDNPAGPCEKLLPGYMSAICEDPRGNIWLGTDAGAIRVIAPYESAPAFKAYATETGGPPFVRRFYVDGRGRLFALHRAQVIEYDPQADRFVPFCNAPDSIHSRQQGYALSAMLIDRDDNLWIGSSMGLSVFLSTENLSGDDPSGLQCYYHKLQDTASLRSHTIQSLAEDSQGRIWIGTANGLTRAHVSGGQVHFRNFSTADQIQNNLIYSVVEDPATGYLWLSTNGGLTRFDPAGNATANFDIHDGLQSNEFNAGAFARTADGEMIFGGIQGFTSFYPSQIRLDTIPPRVFITGFGPPGRQRNPETDADGVKTISLRNNENSFTIDFIGLHFRDPSKNQYAYRLEGFQPDWTSCGNSRQVNFSQLSPGTYVFEVIASNNDGVFSTLGDKLTIVIHPPFYGTVWFYLLLLLVIAGILWGLHMYRLRMKMERVNEVERIRKETAADFHDELGHKLTTISWFSDILRKKLGPGESELKGYLNKIIETSGNMYLTMKDLLWAMDPEKDSIFHTYKQLINFGNELFDHTGIEFNANQPSEELRDIDLPLSYKRHILLIFKEIMHNSLKHGTPTHTYLDLERQNGMLTVRFGDDGTGFDPAKGNGHGHGLRNVRRRAELIHAQAGFRTNGTGTTFELQLKLN